VPGASSLQAQSGAWSLQLGAFDALQDEQDGADGAHEFEVVVCHANVRSD
jgi:hypothetical protein